MAFCENDIRPAEFDDGKFAALREDLDWLRSRQTQFVEVPCPACGSGTHEPAYEKYGFQFRRCRDCRTAYLSPRAPEALLNEFYGNSAFTRYWNEHVYKASREARRTNLFRPRAARLLEICSKYAVPTGCLLEVGASTGIFCEEVRNAGAFERVIAVEPGAALAQSCRELGLETIQDGIENVRDLDARVDVVASFEVIEHLFSPETFLQSCCRLMAPGGVIVVTCPNFEGFDIQVLGAASDSLDAEHINMFNPDSLALLFERCGYEVLECTTPGELDAELVRKKALAGDVDLGEQSFLKTVLLDRWDHLGLPFQEFLKQQGLSSHMWLAARLPAAR